MVNPAFVYRIYEIIGFPEGGWVKLHNELNFPVPMAEQDAGMRYLAFCVCTIGGKLEEAVRTMMASGAVLDSLFLDAAGVAFLEALSTRAYETLQKQAKVGRLQCGCSFGPGDEGLDISFQRQLFNLVDASAIGVRLNETCFLSPAKSLSFLTRWTTSQVTGSRHRCASCTIDNCLYRL